METEVKIAPNRCLCGGSANPGKGNQKDLMICTEPSCEKRWLVLTCACKNKVDYRFQQYCENDYPKCDLRSSSVCILGSKAVVGMEGMMYCNEDLCNCHHSRWAYHECEHCGHVVDYRYAVMCICRECMKSEQYYRICPVCGQCLSQTKEKDHSSQVVRSIRAKNLRLTASKKVVKQTPEGQIQLNLTS